VNFYVDDITRTDFSPRRQYGLVVVKELFWYVIHSLNDVVRRQNRCVVLRGLLLVSQSFPKFDKSYYSNKKLPEF
jgi:hypothetical protein